MSMIIPVRILASFTNVGTITLTPTVIYPNIPVGKTTMIMTINGETDNGIEFVIGSLGAGYHMGHFNCNIPIDDFFDSNYQMACNLRGNYVGVSLFYQYTGGNLNVVLDPNGGPSPTNIICTFGTISASMSEQPIKYEINSIIESMTGSGISINQELVTHGGVRRSSTGISSNISLKNTNDIVVCSPTSGGMIVTLPDSVTFSGKVYSIINKNSNSTTISPSGSDTIDGSGSLVLSTLNAGIKLTSDGTGE